jgi:hypothetical protein
LEIIMATQAQEFFNLHLNGVGYLSRVRWVEPGARRAGRRADRFLSCAINAMHGDAAAVNYTYFDLKVTGQEAIEVTQTLQAATEQGRRVLVSFKAADIYPHMYERRVRVDGEPTDEREMAALIKGRLILIHSVKVDGELVFKHEKVDAEAALEVPDAPPQRAAHSKPSEPATAEACAVEEPRHAMTPPGDRHRLSLRRASAPTAR